MMLGVQCECLTVYPMFMSMCPKCHKQNDYHLIKVEPKPVTFGFDTALRLLKEGKRVKRKHWGGYWFLPADGFVYEDDGVHTLKRMMNQMIVACLKDGDGYAPATPYQEDLLATDWMEA